MTMSNEFNFAAYSDDDQSNEADLARRAFEDVIVLEAGRDGKTLADELNVTAPYIDEIKARKGIESLDRRVEHVLKTSLRVKGDVFTVDPESKQRVVSSITDAPASFNGFFCIPGEPERVDVVYGFSVYMDTTSQTIMSLAQFTEAKKGNGTSVRPIEVLANIDDVTMDFDVMHPSRAEALLELLQPDAFADLESRFANLKSKDLEEVCAALQGFNVPLLSPTEDTPNLRKALRVYVGNRSEIDDELHYYASVLGEYRMIARKPSGKNRRFEYIQKFSMPEEVQFGAMRIDPIDTYTLVDGTPTKAISFGVLGHFYDRVSSKRPAQEVVVPIDSIGAIKSSRGMFNTAWLNSRKQD